MRARLFTKQREFVCEIEMPFFNTPPDVVVWGERHFVLDPYDPSSPRRDGDDEQYREAFAWWVSPETVVE